MDDADEDDGDDDDDVVDYDDGFDNKLRYHTRMDDDEDDG